MRRILIVAVFVVLLCFGPVSAIGPISFGYNGNLVVTFVSQDAKFNDEFGLSTPSPTFLGQSKIATPGQVYNGKGRCEEDIPVVVYIKTPSPSSRTYRSDILSNPELVFIPWPPHFIPLDHAIVTGPLGDGSFNVGFEDSYGLIETPSADYNDVVLNVACIKDNPVPEFPTMALPFSMIIGIVGVVYVLKRHEK